MTHARLEDEPAAARVDDVRILEIRPLISPALLQHDIPADAAVNDFVAASRRRVADIVHGRDPRLLVVVGPCSIHDYDHQQARIAAMHDVRHAAPACGHEVVHGRVGRDVLLQQRGRDQRPDLADADVVDVRGGRLVFQAGGGHRGIVAARPLLP